MSVAIYNEIEPYAARWLRNLAEKGHIANGLVEERSIIDLKAEDLAGGGQRHFFAGIGVWSYALRLAGVPDEFPVWTGSCPCQPFSAAGRQRGGEDARHLWPEWFRLIRECRPPIIFGEQVASADGLAWLDAVSTDLEGAGYAVGASDLCAAGVGAPHIRQRIYFVAYANDSERRAEVAGGDERNRNSSGRNEGDRQSGERREARDGMADSLPPGRSERRSESGDGPLAGSSGDGSRGGLADTDGGNAGAEREQRGGEHGLVAPDGGARVVGDSDSADGGWNAGATGRAEEAISRAGERDRRIGDGSLGSGAARGVAQGDTSDSRPQGHGVSRRDRDSRRRTEIRHRADAGFWSAVDWVQCSDGVARPVEPGTFPLAHGVAGRVGRLRAYGNAIVPQVAAAFIRAALEAIGGLS